MNTGDSVRYAAPPNRPDGLEIRLQCSSEASAEEFVEIIRLRLGFACNGAGPEESLKNFIRKQSAAWCEANEIFGLLNEFVRDQSGDCGTQILQRLLAKGRGNLTQVHPVVQAQAEKKTLLEGVRLRD